ncbi:MAG TPA: BatA domain-containing protein [Blastocatellia bacterium]|nr:BatA domain-containing protein [Blastocatellia bacterium]
MTFAFPLAFLGLLAVPALVAIYWLRSKHRRQTVSSLMLWLDQRQAKEGGLIIHRLQTPLLFFLELLSILLLILAAAGPMTLARTSGPLVVVLDDSFSMLAGTTSRSNEFIRFPADSPRARAAAAVEAELRSGRYKSVRLLLAGESPSLLGDATSDVDQALALLSRWKCFEPSANLDEAVAFAFTLAGSRGRVLVVTDHAPQQAPRDGRLEWRAFGKPGPNLAFVNATRSARDDGERCLLEVANLSSSSATATLNVEAAGSQEPARYGLTLRPNASERVILTLKPGAGRLAAWIGDDALAIDNRIVLLPRSVSSVRVAMQIKNERLRGLVEKALLAAKNASLVSSDPELLLTDDEEVNIGAETWVVQIVSESNAQSYVGPFVINREHPLTEGLSLEGVVWAAGGTQGAAGAPVITAGNVALVTDVERAEGRHDLRVRFRPELSTLQDSPNWPVLIWNLLDWRASQAAGVREANVRLGSTAVARVGPRVERIELRPPDDHARSMAVRDRTLMVRAEAPGVYEIAAGGEKYAFASNAISRQESDVSRSTSGDWGDWNSVAFEEVEQRSLAWAFLLGALLVLAVHLAVASRSRLGLSASAPEPAR